MFPMKSKGARYMKRTQVKFACRCILISALASACSSDQSLQTGQRLFNENCKVCHLQGVNGAPILGNKKKWAKRALLDDATLIEPCHGWLRLDAGERR